VVPHVLRRVKGKGGHAIEAMSHSNRGKGPEQKRRQGFSGRCAFDFPGKSCAVSLRERGEKGGGGASHLTPQERRKTDRDAKLSLLGGKRKSTIAVGRGRERRGERKKGHQSRGKKRERPNKFLIRENDSQIIVGRGRKRGRK